MNPIYFALAIVIGVATVLGVILGFVERDIRRKIHRMRLLNRCMYGRSR